MPTFKRRVRRGIDTHPSLISSGSVDSGRRWRRKNRTSSIASSSGSISSSTGSGGSKPLVAVAATNLLCGNVPSTFRHADSKGGKADEWESSDENALESLLKHSRRHHNVRRRRNRNQHNHRRHDGNNAKVIEIPEWASSDESLLSSLLRKHHHHYKQRKRQGEKHSNRGEHHFCDGESKEEEKVDETSSMQLSLLLQSTIDGDETWFSDLDDGSKASSKSSIQLTLLLQSSLDDESSQECITFEYDEDAAEESSESTLLWQEHRSFASLSGVAILMNVPESIDVPDGTVIDTSATSSAFTNVTTPNQSIKNRGVSIPVTASGDSDAASATSLHETCGVEDSTLFGFYGGGMSSCSSCSSRSSGGLGQTLLRVERLALGTGWVDQDFFDKEGKSLLTLKPLMEEIEFESDPEVDKDEKNVEVHEDSTNRSIDDSNVDLEGLLILQPLAAELPPHCSPPKYDEVSISSKKSRLEAPQPHMDTTEAYFDSRRGVLEVK